jgi:hypothetical protein
MRNTSCPHIHIKCSIAGEVRGEADHCCLGPAANLRAQSSGFSRGSPKQRYVSFASLVWRIKRETVQKSTELFRCLSSASVWPACRREDDCFEAAVAKGISASLRSRKRGVDSRGLRSGRAVFRRYASALSVCVRLRKTRACAVMSVASMTPISFGKGDTPWAGDMRKVRSARRRFLPRADQTGCARCSVGRLERADSLLLPHLVQGEDESAFPAGELSALLLLGRKTA